MDLNVRKITNEELIALLDKRVEFEASNEAGMIDLIAEVMNRRLWIESGATSIFDFMTCTHYHYAPSVAQRKIDSARLLQLFPEVYDYIDSGEVSVTQLGMMGSALRQKPSTPVKVQRQILEAIKGQTIKNTQMILNEMLEIEVKTRPKVRVQRDGSVRVEMTFSKEDWEIIEKAKDVVSHSVSSGDLTEVITYCAKFTVSKKDPSTSIMEVKPRQNSKPDSEAKANANTAVAVGRAARRFVFKRDKTCRFIHPNGHRCESKYQLQVDHVISRCKGGSNDIENLQLLCGLHNRYKYERELH